MKGCIIAYYAHIYIYNMSPMPPLIHLDGLVVHVFDKTYMYTMHYKLCYIGFYIYLWHMIHGPVCLCVLFSTINEYSNKI